MKPRGGRGVAGALQVPPGLAEESWTNKRGLFPPCPCHDLVTTHGRDAVLTDRDRRACI
jgi:hypothetical protein